MKLYHWNSACFTDTVYEDTPTEEDSTPGGIAVMAKSVEEARAKGLVAGLIELGRDVGEDGQPVNSNWVIDELKADLANEPASVETVVYWGQG